MRAALLATLSAIAAASAPLQPQSLVTAAHVAATGHSHSCNLAPVPHAFIPVSSEDHATLSSFTTNGTAPGHAKQRTSMKVCVEPGKGLTFTASATGGGAYSPSYFSQCNSNVWEAAALEVFLAPVASPADAPEWYYEIDASSAGGTFVKKMSATPAWGVCGSTPRANYSNCKRSCAHAELPCTGAANFGHAMPGLSSDVSVSPVSAIHETKTATDVGWTWRLHVPFALFADEFVGGDEPHGSRFWRANVYARGFPQGTAGPIEVSMWSPTYGTDDVTEGGLAHVPVRFGVFELSAARAAVSSAATASSLDFVHIPKNAGTTIEETGVAHGHKWGRYKSPRTWFGDAWAAHGWSFGGWQPPSAVGKPARGEPLPCSPFHIPPAVYQRVLKRNPYANASTFCIVRHPLSRALSEVLYSMRHEPLKSYCSPAQIEKLLDEKLDGLEPFLRSYRSWDGQLKAHDAAAVSDCHWLPQVAYTHGPGVPQCARILRLESLAADWQKLSASTGLGIAASALTDDNASPCPVSMGQLSAAVRARLAKLYAPDLDKLGYAADDAM